MRPARPSPRACVLPFAPGTGWHYSNTNYLVLGWLIAGRMLRPVRTMTERLQQISERNVHERLSLTGPRDELKNLADDPAQGLKDAVLFGATYRFRSISHAGAAELGLEAVQRGLALLGGQ